MSSTWPRPTLPVPVIVGRTPNDYAEELQRFLESLDVFATSTISILSQSAAAGSGTATSTTTATSSRAFAWFLSED